MTKDNLLLLAQSIMENERHWRHVDVADRADSAADLANGILVFFNTRENDCEVGCDLCGN